MAENNNGGCLSWVVLMIGFIPGVIIAMSLPESVQFTGLVTCGVAVVFCSVMALVYKKPQFEDETFGHACKRYMWGMLATMALGVAVALGFSLFGDKDSPANREEGQQTSEQTQA